MDNRAYYQWRKSESGKRVARLHATEESEAGGGGKLSEDYTTTYACGALPSGTTYMVAQYPELFKILAGGIQKYSSTARIRSVKSTFVVPDLRQCLISGAGKNTTTTLSSAYTSVGQIDDRDRCLADSGAGSPMRYGVNFIIKAK